jgi:hypothetical protein
MRLPFPGLRGESEFSNFAIVVCAANGRSEAFPVLGEVMEERTVGNKQDL